MYVYAFQACIIAVAGTPQVHLLERHECMLLPKRFLGSP